MHVDNDDGELLTRLTMDGRHWREVTTPEKSQIRGEDMLVPGSELYRHQPTIHYSPL